MVASIESIVPSFITTVTEQNRSFNQAGVAVSPSKTSISTKYGYDALKKITQLID